MDSITITEVLESEPPVIVVKYQKGGETSLRQLDPNEVYDFFKKNGHEPPAEYGAVVRTIDATKMDDKYLIKLTRCNGQTDERIMSKKEAIDCYMLEMLVPPVEIFGELDYYWY